MLFGMACVFLLELCWLDFHVVLGYEPIVTTTGSREPHFDSEEGVRATATTSEEGSKHAILTRGSASQRPAVT